jgi:hypothetical protein
MQTDRVKTKITCIITDRNGKPALRTSLCLYLWHQLVLAFELFLFYVVLAILDSLYLCIFMKLAPGQNLCVIFLTQLQTITKNLHDRTQGKKLLSLPQTWCTAMALQSLKGLNIPCPAACIRRPPSGLYQDFLIWWRTGQRHFLHFNSIPNPFSLVSLSLLSPPGPQVHNTAGSFCLGG